MPKTGTSSIQLALARAETSGELQPARYPLVGLEDQHRALALQYLSFEAGAAWPRNRVPARDAPQRGRYRRRLFDQLRTTDRAILSSEMFPYMSPDEVHRLRQDLQDVGFGEFRIVLYMRDPADQYLSGQQQSLKASSQLANPVSFRCGFRKAAETWEQVFPGCLVVRPFSTHTKFDAVQDFSSVTQEFLGVTVPRAPKRENVSVSAEGMEILQRYRLTFWPGSEPQRTPDTLRLVEYLQRSRNTLPQTRPQLRPEIAAWIRANHRDDLTFMAQRYGVNLLTDFADAHRPHEFDRKNLHVAEILEHVDDAMVTELLLRIAKKEMDRTPLKRALPARIAKRVLPASTARRLSRRLRSA